MQRWQSWDKQCRLQLRPAHISVLIWGVTGDALPCEKRDIDKNSALVWGRNVSHGQHLHVDRSFSIEILLCMCLKLEHMHAKIIELQGGLGWKGP